MLALSKPALKFSTSSPSLVLRPQRVDMKRAPTGADAPLDNELPTITYLSVTASPRPSLVPPVEPEKSRAARAGLLHASWSASFFQTKFKKGQAASQKRAEASK